MEGSLNECRPQVISLMRQTLQLAEVSQSWAEKYPTLPEDAQKPEAQKYQDEAIKACQAAENSSAKANNAFIDLNNKAQAFQRSLDSQIGARKGQINAANANANALKRNLSPPWYVYLGGLITIGVWMATETAKINDQLNSTVDHLNSMISELTSAKSSGINFDGESLTWQDMVRNVSHDMFFIYNILTGVEGQLMEDPNLYASYIKVEWSQLAENANNVLTILGAHSPATLFTVQGSGLKKLRAVSRSTSTGDKKKLIASVSSSGKLGSTLATQSKQCQDAFKQINIVLGLPWIQDVVGYWDDTKTSKATLFDITANLKREVRLRNTHRPLYMPITTNTMIVCAHDRHGIRHGSEALQPLYFAERPGPKCTERQAAHEFLHQLYSDFAVCGAEVGSKHFSKVQRQCQRL